MTTGTICPLVNLTMLNMPVFQLLPVCNLCIYFSNLLADLDLVNGSTGGLASNRLETTWQTAALLLTDIRSELIDVSPPAPPPRITLATSRPLPLTSFAQVEAQTLSGQIEIVSAFISDLERVLSGQLSACPAICDALTAIASQRVPPQLLASLVQSASSFDQDLTGSVRDLRQRLISLPPSDGGGQMFPLNVFNRPEGFLDATLRHLARQQFKSLHTAHLTIDLVRSTFCLCSFYAAVLIGGITGFVHLSVRLVWQLKTKMRREIKLA